MATLTEIEDALSPLIETLDADGYDLGVTGGDTAVRLEVLPRADACVDCLVPSDMFRMIAEHALGERDLHPEIEVVYPADSAAPH